MSEPCSDAYLEIEAGSAPRKFKLEAGSVCQIGRDELSTIVLVDNQVSRRHAMVQQAPDGKIYLTDLGSRNGTWLNQKRVTCPAALSDGDRITIGIQELRFHGPSWGSQTGAKQDETVVEFVQKLITVLVLDIRDFTGLSRRLPAERLSEVISTLMRESGVVLSEQNAWGQKYIGDAVMAIWLHPASQPALADLLPVFRSLEGIVGIASRLQATLGLDEPIRVGAGINTGTACIGNMGSGASSDYTALSDTVNLAFRLEAATKEIEGDIALGARVYECLAAGADVSDLFQYQQVSLKGYKELKPAYGTHQSSLPELLARIQRSLAEPHLTPSGSIGAGVGA